MGFVKIEKTVKIGRIKEIIEKTYIVPDKILCPNNDGMMSWDSYHNAFTCSNCNAWIKGKDFVENELKQAEEE